MAIAIAVAAVAAVVDSGGRSSVASTAAAAAAYGSIEIERAGIRRDHAIISLEPVGVHTWEMSSIPTW